MNNSNNGKSAMDKSKVQSARGQYNYDINSNNNIFPAQQPQQQQRTTQPVSLRNNYSAYEQTATVMNTLKPLQPPQQTQQPQQPQTRQIDPLSQLSHAFDSFARSSTKITPNNVLTPPAPQSQTTQSQQQEHFTVVQEQPEIEDQDDYRMTLEKNILGDQRMATYAYPQVYREPRGAHFAQLPQNNLILNPKPQYLHIDSTYRDRAKYPNPSQYVMPLVSSNNTIDTSGERYKDIYQISLLSAAVPNIPAVFAQPFLFLQIEEVQGHYDSVSPCCRKAFTKMCFEESGSSAFVKLDKDVNEPAIVVFYPAPLASLDRLSISIRNPDGTLFNFGTDTVPPQSPNPLLQNSFTFQIVSKVVDVIEALGHRNP